MEKTLIVVGWLVAALFIYEPCHAASTQTLQASPSHESTSAQKPAPEPGRRLIMMGADASGSYKLFDTSKVIAASVIRQMQPGDVFYFRKITEASGLDDCALFRLELPRMPAPSNANPFDKRARERERQFGQYIGQLKQDALMRLNAVKIEPAKNTDIMGFLLVAGETLTRADPGVLRVLVLSSDMIDTVGFKPRLDLSQARIVVTGFQAQKDPQKTQQIKDGWVKTFSQAGAANTVFLRAEEPLDLAGISR